MIPLLNTIIDFAPIEIATTVGLPLFAMSWFWRRSLVPAQFVAPRARLVAWLGFGGAGAVLVTGIVMSVLAWRDPFFRWSEGWWRAAPVFVAAIALAALWVAVSRAKSPTLGLNSIAPQRSWRTYLPAGLAGGAVAIAFATVATTCWQMLAGRTPPAGADLYGFTAPDSNLPLYMEVSPGMGYIGGAGWPHHLALTVAVILALVAWACALKADANQGIAADQSLPGGRGTRTVVARIATLVLTGALLMAFGALWARVGFIGEFSLTQSTIEQPDGTLLVNAQVGSSYAAFAAGMKLLGYLCQGIGAALLMRLIVDTARGLRGSKTSGPARGTQTPATAATSGESR